MMRTQFRFNPRTQVRQTSEFGLHSNEVPPRAQLVRDATDSVSDWERATMDSVHAASEAMATEAFVSTNN